MGAQSQAPDRDLDQTTYRREKVDNRLDDNEKRLSRLEKGAILVAGYMISEGGQSMSDVVQMLL